MRRRVRGRALAAGLLAVILGGWLLTAAGPAAASDPTLTGTSVTVADGPGNSMDPHISGDWVTYTNDATGLDVVHYHNLATSTDASIPNNGGNDTLSGVSGTTVVYTHVDASGNYSINTFGIGSGNPPAALTEPGAVVLNPAIGGDTVAWVDMTANPETPQIMVDDTATGTVTQLTSPGTVNLEPAVSPDGSVVTWVQCAASGTPCDVWDAILAGGTWASSQLTDGAASGIDSQEPHTDGTIVTYSSDSGGVQNIYWQPVGGGTVQQIPNPDGGTESNPHASGGLISFEDNSSGQVNIGVYSLATQTVYQVPGTPGVNATLNDISATGGTASVVWQAQESGQYNIYGFIFPVPQAALSVTTTSLPGATLGTGYSAALAATGGTAPYTWQVTSGSLPPGLSLDSATGVISGTPVLPGTSGFTVQATDSSGPVPQTATAALSITAGGCATTITGTHNGPLGIGAGVTCLQQATVTGPVKITAGAVVSVQGSTLRGPLTATGAASMAVCGSSVAGPASVSGATGLVLLDGASGSPCAVDTIGGPVTLSGDAGGVMLAGATVSGPATVSGNGGGVTLSGNSIGGPATVTGNTGGTLVAGNTISGPLSCSANNPAPTDGGQPNTVKGSAAGQCSALA